MAVGTAAAPLTWPRDMSESFCPRRTSSHVRIVAAGRAPGPEDGAQRRDLLLWPRGARCGANTVRSHILHPALARTRPRSSPDWCALLLYTSGRHSRPYYSLPGSFLAHLRLSLLDMFRRQDRRASVSPCHPVHGADSQLGEDRSHLLERLCKRHAALRQ
eukprot:scaffold14290_cov125-Isochrysis_galbana.AAC.5